MPEGDRPHAVGEEEATTPEPPSEAPTERQAETPAQTPAQTPADTPAQTPEQTLEEPDEPARDRGPLLRRTAEAGVVLLLAVTAGAHAFDLGDRLGLAAPDPGVEPQAVAPPPGLDLPEAQAARPVAGATGGAEIDRLAVSRAVSRLAANKRLGKRVAVVVAGTDGAIVHRSGPAVMTPASTLKMVTSLAALEAVGPQHRFTTTVVRSGRTLTLVGGGDPLLERRPAPAAYPERADLRTLARRTAEALRTTAPPGPLRLTYDDSLFTGPAVNPTWEPDYIPTNVVSPISALWVDAGRSEIGFGIRVADPAAEAARVFRAELRRAGVRATPPRPATAPDEVETVAAVRSAPLVGIVQHVLEASDNESAEVLLRHVALARDLDASFAGGARAVREVLRELGIRTAGLTMYDGSGLSRQDRIAPGTLLEVLARSLDPERPRLEGVASGLPVAGFSGSLARERFVIRAEAGLGRVRAKTGTLRGVHGLSGVVVGRDGSVMLYAVLTDRVKEPDVLFARAHLDRISSALAACRCGA